MIKYVVTGGQNRISHVYMFGDESQVEALVEHLQTEQAKSPDLTWQVFNPEEVRDIIGEVQNEPESFRLRDGHIETRPRAWVDVSNAAPVVGDSISVEFNSDVSVASPKMVMVNGSPQISPVIIECDEPMTLTLVPLSAELYCHVTTIRIS